MDLVYHVIELGPSESLPKTDDRNMFKFAFKIKTKKLAKYDHTVYHT